MLVTAKASQVRTIVTSGSTFPATYCPPSAPTSLLTFSFSDTRPRSTSKLRGAIVHFNRNFTRRISRIRHRLFLWDVQYLDPPKTFSSHFARKIVNALSFACCIKRGNFSHLGVTKNGTLDALIKDHFSIQTGPQRTPRIGPQKSDF